MSVNRKFIRLAIAMSVACIMGGCNGYSVGQTQTTTNKQTDMIVSEETTDKPDSTTDYSSTESSVAKKDEEIDSEPNKTSGKEVDVILFMGESNMSGFGGDASLAPKVSEDAGVEFRAVSDPTKFYPITEPFGEKENNPDGLNDYLRTKKGSLVSAFVNEYHDLTGRKVVAVSASMGSTDMDMWTSEGVMTDVKQRFDVTLSFVKDKGYDGHVYAVWLQGESDGLKGAAESTYREELDKFTKPLFKAGLEKMFIIVPGRTIDYTDVYQNVIDIQIDICKKDDHYALATTVLPLVSTEYMTDQYQYNQHTLNYVGTEAAKSVAYFTMNGVEKIVYDYKNGQYVVPRGVKEDSQEKEELVYPSDVDIDKL